mmetsp:Transcript_6224/g.12597  ORF Transcript_6224/g.12597 Transcript_6224/m.12597 type:complete len:164 (+) Transcript_6224:26-517(+)
MSTQENELKLLCAELAEILEFDHVDPDAELCTLGLNALAACELSGWMKSTFNMEATPCMLFEACTPRDVIDRLFCDTVENNYEDQQCTAELCEQQKASTRADTSTEKSKSLQSAGNNAEQSERPPCTYPVAVPEPNGPQSCLCSKESRGWNASHYNASKDNTD